MSQGKMRLSTQQGRCGGKTTQHNARYLKNPEERTHINTELSKGNILLVKLNGEFRRVPSAYFKRVQVDTYETLYGDHLEVQNKKYHESRHYKSEKNIEQFFDSKRTGPIETILQIGKEGEYEKSEENVKKFTKMALEYIHEIEEAYPSIHFLGLAIHTDEASIHGHVTWTISAPDKEGFLAPQQDKGLALMGIEPPDPTKEISRYNNRLQTITALTRQIWFKIVKKIAPEIEIEEKPLPSKKKRLEIMDYKLTQSTKKIKKMQEIIEKQQEIIDSQLSTIENLTESAGMERAIGEARQRQKGRSR